MRLAALPILMTGTTGCHQLFGLDGVDPGPPGFTCMEVSPTPLFCADFDDDDALIYNSGVASALPAAPPGVTIERRAPAMSPPNALWVDAQTARYAIELDPATPVVTKLHASLAAQVARFEMGTSATELIEIGVRDQGSFGSCTARLQIDPAGPRIDVQSLCNGGRNDTTLFVSLPAGWAHYTMDFDIAAGTVTASLDDQQMVVHSLGLTSATGGTPHVAAGVLFVNTMGPEIGLDDVVVRVTP